MSPRLEKAADSPLFSVGATLPPPLLRSCPEGHAASASLSAGAFRSSHRSSLSARRLMPPSPAPQALTTFDSTAAFFSRGDASTPAASQLPRGACRLRFAPGGCLPVVASLLPLGTAADAALACSAGSTYLRSNFHPKPASIFAPIVPVFGAFSPLFVFRSAQSE